MSFFDLYLNVDILQKLPTCNLWKAISSSNLLFFFTNLFYFIYLFNLFLAALGLHCCARAFSSCGERGLLFIAVPGLLIAVASLVAERGL